jgi:integrase
VLLAAFCGLRFGELAALTVGRLDLLHGTVAVAASAAELTGGVRHVGPPKSVAGRRTIAIPDVIAGDLREHVARFAQGGATGLVFVGPKGGRLRNANFGRSVWRPAVRAVGVHGLHFHDLRGCAATLAAITGATTAELMHRLGHATPDVALRYQRATADRDAAIAKALSELVTKASVAPLPTNIDRKEPHPKATVGATEPSK